MGLAEALGIALTIQSIELFGKILIDVARKKALEGTWFDTQIDHYRFKKLFLNY